MRYRDVQCGTDELSVSFGKVRGGNARLLPPAPSRQGSQRCARGRWGQQHAPASASGFRCQNLQGGGTVRYSAVQVT
jgi:hypothetical protein